MKKENLITGFSVCASWAGIGSMVNTITIYSASVAEGLFWIVCNTLACCVFGWIVKYFPKLIEVMRTRAYRMFLFVIAFFQIWLNLSGTEKALMMCGVTNTIYIAIGFGILCCIILMKDSLFRNIISDNAMWYLVMLFVIIAGVIVIYTGNKIDISPTYDLSLKGIKRGVMLLVGPLYYPYFLDLIKEGKNSKGFVYGGIIFGVYLVAILMFVYFGGNKISELFKGSALVFVALTSISSFIASFNYRYGVIGTLFCVITVFMYPLGSRFGALGLWDIIGELRLYATIIAIMYIIAKGVYEKKNKRA